MTAKNNSDGTMTTVITTTGAILDGVLTVDSTNATIVEFDNSGANDNWPTLKMTFQGTYSVAPDAANRVIDIFRYETEIDRTASNDVAMASTTDAKGGKRVGGFVLDDVTTEQFQVEYVSLIGVRKCKFAIQQNAGGSSSLASGAIVKAEGISLNDE